MILVSACLAGFPCRYDGSAGKNEKIQELVAQGKALPVCPEQLGGLPTPRLPAEISAGKVISRDGTDVSGAFKKGAETVLSIAKEYGITEAVLKARSPSCGKGCVHDGSFSGALVQGNGITADLLLKNGIVVKSEEEIDC
jgi:uncharacterized protein YbbK (DUF523 family)